MRASPTYPKTPRDDAIETVAGVQFPDPYHWLEDGGNPEVRAWQREQNELTSAYLARLTNLDAVRALVDRYTTARFLAMPRYAGGRWFRRDSASGEVNHPPLEVAETPTGPGRVLFDPDAVRSDHPLNIEWFSPSPDGRLVAFGLTIGGSENNTIHIMDVESGQELADAIPHIVMDSWTGGARWLPDGSGFYYLARYEGGEEFRQAIYLHRIGEPPPEQPDFVLEPESSGGYGLVQFDREGRRAVTLMRLRDPRPVAVRDLPDGDWKPFLPEIKASVMGVIVGDRYVAITDLDAPRGKLVAIPFDSPAPQDPATWEVLLPESEAVLRTVRLSGNRLFLNEFVDTYARIRILDLDGSVLGEVPLPGKGAIAELPFPLMNALPGPHPDVYIFGFSSLTSSWGLYRYDAEQGGIEELRAPAVTLDATVEDCWATSFDGTRIPYHIVRRRDADSTSPLPALLYGYGGFNAPWVPQFPNAMAAFVHAGGVFVHTHLRGGGELGRDWWHDGRRKNKQNGYNDLYAIAEDLIARGISTPSRLAVTGASGGGLLSGVAETQRPDLWAAVAPQVPVFDLIGDLRDPYGRLVVDEFADPDDSDDVRRLATFSPYQLVRDGELYPATFILAGDTDPRCPPWHARKFAARLQGANASGEPILLRVWEDTGHGWSNGRQETIDQATEWLAFVFDRLGMRLR